MAAKRSVLELTLDSVELGRAAAGGGASRHILTVTLVCPRPTIHERTFLKELRLLDGALSLADAMWVDRVLCKETVEGPFGVKVGVTDHLADDAFSKFVRFALGGAAKVVGSAVEGAIAGAVAGPLVAIPFEYVASLLRESGDAPPPAVARAALDLSPDDDWPAGLPRALEFALTASADITRVERGRLPGKSETRRRTVAGAGSAVGAVRMSAVLRE